MPGQAMSPTAVPTKPNCEPMFVVLRVVIQGVDESVADRLGQASGTAVPVRAAQTASATS